MRLSETITDDSDGRLCTEEALVFDLDAQGQIARVEVFLQKSHALDGSPEPSGGLGTT